MALPLSVLIVDDMALARKRVRRYLDADSDVAVAGEAAGGREAIALIGSLQPQLVLLDVQMPEVDGFDVIEAVGPQAMPLVIFVTAHDEFALRAFEVNAIDYLLKPFDAARFAGALARAKREIARDASARQASRLLAVLDTVAADAARPRRLAIKSAGRTVFVPMEDIDYIEAAGNYLRLQAGSEAHMIRDRIGDMEARLDPARFVRIHRSTIVNRDRIKHLEPLFNGDQQVTLTTGKRLTASRTYRQRLMD